MVKLRLLMLIVLPVEATSATRALPATMSIPASLRIAGVVMAIIALAPTTVVAFKVLMRQEQHLIRLMVLILLQQQFLYHLTY
jgi:hypothetical protein